jgi:hypothetical protein
MTTETHAIIMTQGEDLATELHKNMREGNLLTKLTDETFPKVIVKNLKYIRIADQRETDHHDKSSIWIEVTITF